MGVGVGVGVDVGVGVAVGVGVGVKVAVGRLRGVGVAVGTSVTVMVTDARRFPVRRDFISTVPQPSVQPRTVMLAVSGICVSPAAPGNWFGSQDPDAMLPITTHRNLSPSLMAYAVTVVVSSTLMLLLATRRLRRWRTSVVHVRHGDVHRRG